MRKRQLILIHGGDTFKNRSDYLNFLRNRPIYLEKQEIWSGDYLEAKLSAYFNILKPKMPCGDNAKYEEWKLYFDRFLEIVDKDLVLIVIL
ncbi:MAG: hypothetical protein K9M44_02295 [Candidatus Pacebacteria bacterium]|nr:hypothetical protein [Candidatus Paceibacterota bacterium]